MSAERTIRILVVDDHTVVRRGLIFVLQTFDDLVPVGEAGTIEEVVRRCEIDQPDVILMDIKLTGEADGIAATKIIRERYPDIQVFSNFLVSFSLS